MGERSTAPPFLTSALNRSGQLEAPTALPPGNSPGTHFMGGWADPRTGLDVMEKRKNLLDKAAVSHDNMCVNILHTKCQGWQDCACYCVSIVIFVISVSHLMTNKPISCILSKTSRNLLCFVNWLPRRTLLSEVCSGGFGKLWQWKMIWHLEIIQHCIEIALMFNFSFLVSDVILCKPNTISHTWSPHRKPSGVSCNTFQPASASGS
jgi:hypothetical protein